MALSESTAALESAFRFRARRAELEASELLRGRLVLEGPQGPVVRAGNETLLNFSSNDYLGLAADARVIAALQEGAGKFGVGSGSSAFMSGWRRTHAELEEQIAAFTRRDRALLFCSGYMANLSLGLSGLAGAGDTMVEDRLNHASLVDAARISGARLQRYAHADAAAAGALLQSAPRRKLALTDGVFSMDGDLTPVIALAAACRGSGALLVVDDAHGLGVLGASGGGILELTQATQCDVPLLVGTFGKAFGTSGAFIAGGQDAVEYLAQRARTHIYTTAPPPAIAHATSRALEIVTGEPERRDRLANVIVRFRTAAMQLGLSLLPSTTPIQPVILGSARHANTASAALRARGILVTAVRPPTVPQGTSRLRITLTAAHDPEHVERLVEALGEVCPATEPP